MSENYPSILEGFYISTGFSKGEAAIEKTRENDAKTFEIKRSMGDNRT